MCAPYILYFINFSGLLPGNDQNWANFGSFIGGVITSVFSFASFVILFTNYIFDKENITKIEILQKHLVENKNIYYNETNKICYDSIISKIDEISSPYILQKEITSFVKDAVNFYYFIDSKLRNEYDELIEIIVAVSSNGMQNFNIVEYSKKIDQHIISINENILNKKIKLVRQQKFQNN